MIGSQQVSAQQLVNLLQEWIGSEQITLSVQARLLGIDMNCAVALTSFAEPECQTLSTTTTTEEITSTKTTSSTTETHSTQTSSTSQETNSTPEASYSQETIIIGIVLGVLLILALSIGTVVVVMFVRRSKRAKVAVTSQE